jgi:hypothetical protein
VAVGLGGAPRADLVSLLWSDGVLQSELALEAGRVHLFEETQRQLSSCPVLFAHDGSAMRFVTDILGVGGIGFFERPGVYSPPFPDESVLLPERALAPAGGRMQLVIGEPMEEVAYFDRFELVAWDLPPGWQLALDERKAIASPPPTGAPLFYREERLPVRATNDRGHDVREQVVAADLRAAPPGAPDPRFIGMTAPHQLTLEFDRPLDDGPGRPVLVLDGWIEYPYAQTVFAAWQANAPFAAPTLEARDRTGRWRAIAPEFGYPAGMPRRSRAARRPRRVSPRGGASPSSPSRRWPSSVGPTPRPTSPRRWPIAPTRGWPPTAPPSRRRFASLGHTSARWKSPPTSPGPPCLCRAPRRCPRRR